MGPCNGSRCAILLALVVYACAVPAAEAVMPRPGATFVMHDHRTAGDGWHIEMTAAADRPFLRQLVLHSERCGETILTTHVRVRDDGTIESSKPFATSDDRTGNWRLSARWVAPNHVTGNFQVTTPGCDGGVRMFSAHQGDHDHDHAGHTAFGTPLGSYPDLDAGSSEVRAQLESLREASVNQATHRFATYRDVVALGFRRWHRPWEGPLMFHVRHRGYERDGRAFDPRRPESLVYWWPPAGEPVLVAFMYRMALPDGWPQFGRPLLGWHAHGGDKPGSTLMTHVWMTADLRSAIANCMPVAALEAFNSAFRFQPIPHDLTHESAPCPEEVP
jgi:hypothetical protein